MCGIVGFCTKGRPEARHWNYLGVGLLADTVRGKDSTGIAAVSSTGEARVWKRALPGPDFLHSAVFDQAEKVFGDFRYFIGHNRAATAGSVTDENAHPFLYKGASAEIVLVHNGTISNWRNSELSPKDFNHPVDSAHIARGFAEYGEQFVLERIEGWYVLVWVNTTNKTFNIARGNNRDISIGWTKDSKEIFYGSEAGMINWLTERNDIIIPDGFKSPREFEWIQWNMDDPTFRTYEKKAIKKFVPPIVITPHTGKRRFSPGSAHDRLRELGHEPGKKDSIAFSVEGFHPYSSLKPDFGHVLGKTSYGDPCNPAQNIKIYGIMRKDFDEVLNHEYHRSWCTGTPERVDFQTGEIITSVNMEELRADIALKKFVKADKDRPLTPIQEAMKTATETHRQTWEKTKNPTGTKLITTTNQPVLVIGESCELPQVEVPSNTKVVGPHGDLIGSDEWRRLVRDGCAECSSPIHDVQHEKLVWIGELGYDCICHGCSDKYRANGGMLPIIPSSARISKVV